MQKVGVDNSNPVKTSNKQARGNSSDIFVRYVDSRTKKLTHRPGKILLKKHVNLEKGQKFYLVFCFFCFFFVFTCKNLIHAMFLKFQFHFLHNPGPCRIPDPRATFENQMPTPRASLLS